MVVRLLAREEADRDKQRAEHQPDQHDLAVGALVGGVKGRGHRKAIQLAACRAIQLDF